VVPLPLPPTKALARVRSIRYSYLPKSCEHPARLLHRRTIGVLAIEQRRFADIIAVVFEQVESDGCGFLGSEEAYLRNRTYPEGRTFVEQALPRRVVLFHPSTTLANLFTPLLLADLSSAVWASLRSWLNDEFDYGAAYGRHDEEDQLIDIDEQSLRLHGDIVQSKFYRVPGVGHMVHQTAMASVMSAITQASTDMPSESDANARVEEHV
jgi:hypothetical protein